MSETCEQCSTSGACPFASTESSELVQNLGCLPTPHEIIQMRQLHNKTWACHSNPSKPCLGAMKYMKENKLEYTVVDNPLVTEDNNWDDWVK